LTEDNTTYQSRFHRLLERATQDAPKWEHDEDTLLGTVADLDEYVGDYGSCKTVVVEAEEGSTEAGGDPIPVGELRTFYASRTVAAKKVAKELAAGLKVSDPIVIRHFGIPEGREYHDYAVKSERAEPEEPGRPSLNPAVSTGGEYEDDIPY
jgi:hypothetical protein